MESVVLIRLIGYTTSAQAIPEGRQTGELARSKR